MHFEQSAILTVHNHVITRNPRISVTHDKHRTWFLHINNVQEEDKGRYMCQINTVTAKTEIGYLHVVGKSIICIAISVANCNRIWGGQTIISFRKLHCYRIMTDEPHVLPIVFTPKNTLEKTVSTLEFQRLRNYFRTTGRNCC